MNKPSRILILTAHLYDSKQKAGFHHLTQALYQLGHHISFCTVRSSLLCIPIMLMKTSGNIGYQFVTYSRAFFPKRLPRLSISSYISWVHHFNNAPFGRLLYWLYQCGYSNHFRRCYQYDIVIVESGIGVFFVKRLKKRLPEALFIYRASDPLKEINASSFLIDYEKTIRPYFNLISSPIDTMTNQFKADNPSLNAKTHVHGIQREALDLAKTVPSPYQRTAIVYVGMDHVDWDFIRCFVALDLPMDLHIIGPVKPLIKSCQLRYHGLLPFSNTLPYIAHATVAITFKMNRHVDQTKNIQQLPVFANSLKMLQYTYYQKPILVHRPLAGYRPHFIGYDHTESSVKQAIQTAMDYPNDQIDTSYIQDWKQVAIDILTDARAI